MKINPIISIILVTLSSCSQDISTPVVIDKDQTERLVVNGYVAFVNQSSPIAAVQVSKTKKLSQPGSPEIIADASVFINSSPLPYDSDSKLYMLPSGLQPSTNYQLKTLSGKFNVDAEDILPAFIPIAEAHFTGNKKTIVRYAGNTGEEYHELKISFDDPPQAGDYYQLLLSPFDSNMVASGFVFGSTEFYYDFACNDVAIYEEQVAESDPFSSTSTIFIPSDMMLFQDKYFNGQRKEITLYVNQYFFTDFDMGSPNPVTYENVYIGLHHMSKKSFEHYKNVKLQELNEGNPFAEPTIVSGNINGALGFFGCRAVATTKLKGPF